NTGGGTNGLLTPDLYTVILVSGPQAFQDTNHNLLDGDSNGVGGDNYTSTFLVITPPSNAVTVSVPDFARGPDIAPSDSINLVFNAAGTSTASPLSGGIPVALHIPAGDSVTSAVVTLQYNAGSLSIASAFSNPSLSNASF